MAGAKKRVEIIIWTNRDKEKPTHFISIPLIQPHIKERIADFKTTVLELCRRVSQASMWLLMFWHSSAEQIIAFGAD